MLPVWRAFGSCRFSPVKMCFSAALFTIAHYIRPDLPSEIIFDLPNWTVNSKIILNYDISRAIPFLSDRKNLRKMPRPPLICIQKFFSLNKKLKKAGTMTSHILTLFSNEMHVFHCSAESARHIYTYHVSGPYPLQARID